MEAFCSYIYKTVLKHSVQKGPSTYVTWNSWGSVWEMILLFEMIWTVRFCSFSNRSILKTEAGTKCCKCSGINWLYNKRIMSFGKNLFRRHIQTNALAIPFDIFGVSTRNLNCVTLSIGLQFIFKVGLTVVTFCRWWRKIITVFYMYLKTIYLYYKLFIL